jgi:hypothetical protein
MRKNRNIKPTATSIAGIPEIESIYPPCSAYAVVNVGVDRRSSGPSYPEARCLSSLGDLVFRRGFRRVSWAEAEDRDETGAGQGLQGRVELVLDLDLRRQGAQQRRHEAVVAVLGAIHLALGTVDLHGFLLLTCAGSGSSSLHDPRLDRGYDSFG